MSFRHDRLANSAIFIRHRYIGEQHIAPSSILHQRKGNAAENDQRCIRDHVSSLVKAGTSG
jgi:hypothetical protein